jgi:hypothetical protein
MNEIKFILEINKVVIPPEKQENVKLIVSTIRMLYSIIKRMLCEKNESFKFTPKNRLLWSFEIFFPSLNGIIHPIEKVGICLDFSPEDTYKQDDLDYVIGNWIIMPYTNKSSNHFSTYHFKEYKYEKEITKKFKNFDINGLVEEILNLFNTPYLLKDEFDKYEREYENEEV